LLVLCDHKKMKSSGHMHVVIDAAKRAAAAGEVPVAAAVIDAKGQIIVVAENRMKRDANATSHAELLALQAAMSITGNSRLDGCDLWVSLEPCAMCAGAIAHARIRRLYFAATDEKGGAVESGVRFFDSPTCHHKPDIYGGIQAVAAQQLLTDFFAARR
jgi:tRNA(adenine34) deaminase